MHHLLECFWSNVAEDYFIFLVMITVLMAIVLTHQFVLRRQAGNEHVQAATYPPGPFALPIIGNLLQLGRHPHMNLSQLADIHGNIFSLRIGSRKVVVVNSVHLAREVFNKNARQLSDRPAFHSFKVNSNMGKSIAFGNTGHLYSYHKNIATRALGKIFKDEERMNQIANEEVMKLKNSLRNDPSGELIEVTSLIKGLVFNFSFRIVFGDNVKMKFAHEFQSIFKKASTFVENNTAVNLVDFFPWLEKLFQKQTDKIKQSVDLLMNFVSRICTETRTSSANAEAQCIAGALDHSSVLGTDGAELSEDSRVQIIADLFGGGLETVSTTMCWAMLYLANHQDLQEELHAELESVVKNSESRVPRIQDKPKMPLVQATVLEILRMSSVLPLGLPHYCSQDTVAGGYKVDQGTVVLMNLWAINHDPRSFAQPHVFNPHRFLDPETNEIKTDDWLLALPFSTGTRRCLGATLAKAELFLLLVGLLNNFRFELKEGNIDLDGVFGLTLKPNASSAVLVYKRF